MSLWSMSSSDFGASTATSTFCAPLKPYAPISHTGLTGVE